MRPNRSKDLARSDRPALGTMCNAASPLLAEWLGHSGFDFVVIDLQHGENSIATVGPMLQALSATPATPIVRVLSKDPTSIGRVLDLGAYGVIVPQVDTAEQAHDLVRSVRYAPRGTRSWGPLRGMLYGGADYFDGSADTLLTLAMIESAEGLQNARDILAVDGLDGCFVGPADLNITLGHSPDDPLPAAETEDGVASVARVARELNKIAGVHAFGLDDARRRLAQGFRLMTLMADTRLIRAAATPMLATLRDEAIGARPP